MKLRRSPCVRLPGSTSLLRSSSWRQLVCSPTRSNLSTFAFLSPLSYAASPARPLPHLWHFVGRAIVDDARCRLALLLRNHPQRHNTATNEWTYTFPGNFPGAPQMPQPAQMVGYAPPAMASPGGVYGWPGTPGTVPYQGQYVFGGAPPSSLYAPGAAQQVVNLQQMQQMQQMMAASQQHAGNGGGGMVGGAPAMMAWAASPGAGAGIAAGVAGYAPMMVPDPGGPGSSFDPTRMTPAGFGGAAGGAAARGTTTLGELSEPFDGVFPTGTTPSRMQDRKQDIPKKREERDAAEVAAARAAQAAAAATAASSGNVRSSYVTGSSDRTGAGADSGAPTGPQRRPTLTLKAAREAAQAKAKAAAEAKAAGGVKEAEDGDGGGAEGKETAEGGGPTPPRTVVGGDDDSDTATAVNDYDHDEGDNDGGCGGGGGGGDGRGGSDVENEVLAAIAAAVACSSRRELPPEPNGIDQRESGGGGESNDHGAGGVGEEAVGSGAPYYDGNGGECYALHCYNVLLNQFLTPIAHAGIAARCRESTPRRFDPLLFYALSASGYAR